MDHFDKKSRRNMFHIEHCDKEERLKEMFHVEHCEKKAERDVPRRTL